MSVPATPPTPPNPSSPPAASQAQSLSRAARRWWWWTLWALLAVLAVGFAVGTVPPYVVGGTSRIPINPDVAWHYLSLAVHAVPGGLALLLGPFQFVPRLLSRWPRLHRVTGVVYLLSVLAASVAALFAATVSKSGFSPQVAFYLLAAAWLYTGARAYRAIRRGEVQLHRIWMIRNYALTFAAATLRVYLLVGLQLKGVLASWDYDTLYATSVWASVLGNALVAEYVIVQRVVTPLAARRRGRAGGRGAATGAAAAEPVGARPDA